MLTSKQRAHLSGLAHDKNPVVWIGHQGLTDAVVKEVDGGLKAHELIKVKLPEGGENLDLDDLAAQIATRSKAELVARIGRIAVVYKQHPQKPKIELPGTAKKKKKKKGLFDEAE